VYLRCRIYRNSSDGVWLAGGTMQECQIYSNGTSGVNVSSGGMLRNCLIYNNVGDGITLGDTRTAVENCTIAGNSNGVSVEAGMVATNIIRNSILYGNFAGTDEVNYSCPADSVFGCSFTCVRPLPLNGTGNIDGDPLFMNAPLADFRLQTNSPCINAGTNLNWMATATDIGGDPRILRGRVDMGADEACTYHYVSTNSPVNGPGTAWSNAFHTIQGAVAVSFDEDAVLVTNGTYRLTNEVAITNGITVRSTGGSALTTVDGNYTTRCFRITHPNAVVQGFTITRGSNSQDWVGGGAYLSAGTVKDCVIISNTTGDGQGGGVYFYHGGVISNCVVQENSANSGAGIYCEYGGAVFGGSIISNTASGRAGGMRFFGGGYLADCTVIGNTGNNWGGAALRFDNGGGVATNCTITRHTSSDGGGVIRFSGGGSVYNCTISSNSGPERSVFFDNYNAGTVVNCRVVGNVSGDGLGGCAFMKDCYVAGNTATNEWEGAMTVDDGSTAIGCTIVGNWGRGVRVWAGSLIDSTIVSNWGGGVELCGGGSLVNCTSRWNRAAWGGGVNCWGGNNRISGCRISDNLATNGTGGGVAAGMGDELRDCIVTGNWAENGSGGVWFNEGGTASNCLIVGNEGEHGGGAACYLAGVFQNCTISGNTARGVGGGLSFNNGGRAANCLVTGNTSGYNGRGIDCYRGGEVLNCTVCGNNASMGSGPAVFLNEGGTVRNSILQNGTDWSYNNGGWTMEYCRYSMMNPATSPGPGNIYDDPQFVDAAGGDFRLATNSPCIDKGTNADWMASATDLDGKPRLLNAVVDMGAYESIPPVSDSDADQIPDWWMWKYFRHFTGMAEDQSRATDSADGTGVDNLYKYTADLDPTNPLSVFQIAAIGDLSPGHSVSFHASPDRWYSLRWATNLVSGGWLDVSDQVGIQGEGTLMSLTDTNAAPGRFYQVGVQAP
jgi:hypothetical protein